MPPQKLPNSEELERIRIGATLRAIRESQGRSLDDVANAVDKSRSYLANIEAGRKPLTRALSIKLVVLYQLRTPDAIVRPGYFADDASMLADLEPADPVGASV